MAKRSKNKKGKVSGLFGDKNTMLSSPESSPEKTTRCVSLTVTNSDIFKAIQELSSRLSAIEQKMNSHSTDMMVIKENVRGIDYHVKNIDDKLKAMEERMSDLEKKLEETERYSRRWNLRLYNLPESTNETAEDTRRQVLNVFGDILPEEKNKLDFLVDTVHRTGRRMEDTRYRPVIIQFTMRTFRQKIWQASKNATVMKEKRLRLAEDLTFQEKQSRNKLWPLVKQARDERKKTSWRGPDAIIEGKRVTVEMIKDL